MVFLRVTVNTYQTQQLLELLRQSVGHSPTLYGKAVEKNRRTDSSS